MLFFCLSELTHPHVNKLIGVMKYNKKKVRFKRDPTLPHNSTNNTNNSNTNALNSASSLAASSLFNSKPYPLLIVTELVVQVSTVVPLYLLLLLIVILALFVAASVVFVRY